MTTPTAAARERLAGVLAELARADAPEEFELDAGELLDYLDGRLPADARARLERRLVADPDAASRLVDLADFQRAAEGAGSGPADLAARSAWREFQARRPETVAAAPRAPRVPPVWASLAAALLLANVGLGAWVARLQGEIGRPVANPSTLNLAGAVRSPSDPTVLLTPGRPLRLVVEPTGSCTAYDAELIGPGPDDRTPVPRLERDAFGVLSLYLPRIAPGSYRLTVSPCDPAGRPTEHRFRVVPPPAGAAGGGG